MAGYFQSSYSSHGEGVGIDNNGEVAVSGRFYYLMDFDTNNNNRMYAYQQSSNWDCLWPNGMQTVITSGRKMQAVRAQITAMILIWTKPRATLPSLGCITTQHGSGTLNSHLPVQMMHSWLMFHLQAVDWMKKFGSSSSEYGYSVAMRNGMFAFGGYFHNTATDGSGQISYSAAAGADGFILMYGADQDGDGIGDQVDDFPWEPSQWRDTDGDGLETILVVGKGMLVRSMAIQPLIDTVVPMPMVMVGQMLVTICPMKSRSGLTVMVMGLVKTPLE